MSEVLWKQHPTLGIWCTSDGQVLNSIGHGSSKTRLTYGCLGRKGYRKVSIHSKTYNVHRLIAETFLDPVEGKPYVDHINRNKDDNRVQNLRYVNAFENNENGRAADRIDYGVREFEDKKSYDAARYRALKSDPEKYQAHLARHREKYRERKNKERTCEAQL